MSNTQYKQKNAEWKDRQKVVTRVGTQGKSDEFTDLEIRVDKNIIEERQRLAL